MRILRSALALTSVLALAVTGCGTSTDATSGGNKTEKPATSAPAEKKSSESKPADGDVPKGNGETIYLVSKGFQHRFWQAVREGAEKAGKEFNYKIEFVGPQSETQVTEQLNMLRTAIDSKPAAIGLAALDTGAAESLLNEIKEKKIPLVAFDSGVDSDIPLSTVATDNYAAAQEAAKHMVELTGGKGTVGLICHDQTSQTGKQRCNGFKEYLEKNAKDIKVLQPQVAGEVGAATNAALSLIQANSDLVGIYGTNEAAATGVAQAADESGKKDLKVVGFDSGKTQIDAIKKGVMAGAVTQAPIKMGYETVVAAIKAIHGQEVPKVIDSGFSWYNAENIDDPEIKSNLYE